MKTKYDKYKKVQAHTRYIQNDKQVPGVTTITKYIGEVDPIAVWSNRLGLEGIDMLEYRRELARIGTLWHELIEYHLTTERLDNGVHLVDVQDYTPRQVAIASRLFNKFKIWEESHVVVPIQMEAQFVSKNYPYGGTGDFFGMIDGDMCYMDFKSTDSVKLEHHLQACACANLWNEHHPDRPIEKMFILQASRDHDMSFGFVPIGSYQEKFDLFLSLLDVHQKVNAIKKEETYGR